MTSLYCSLADVRAELNASSTVDDAKIMPLIRKVTARINQKFQAFGASLFVPFMGVRKIAITGANVNSLDGVLGLVSTRGIPQLILVFTDMSIGSQSLTVGTNVQLYPPDTSPYTAVQLLGSQFWSWYNITCNSGVRGPQIASVTGVWGYNADYVNAWLNVDTLAAAILNSTATTFTVADVDGENPLGEIPRISAGNVVQIDSEWMDVIKTDTGTNTVTVRRGVNGSTAAAHGNGSIVSVYQVDDNIRRATSRQVSFMYARQGAYDTARIDGVGVIQFPQDTLAEFNALLSLFANIG